MTLLTLCTGAYPLFATSLALAYYWCMSLFSLHWPPKVDFSLKCPEIAPPPKPQTVDDLEDLLEAPLPTPKRPASDTLGEEDGGPSGSQSASHKKGTYFEFAKKKWEVEDTFRLPDGTFWPEVNPIKTL